MRCVGSKQIQMDLERSHLIMVEGLEARSWFTMFLLDPCCSESVCAIKWYQENADADALSKLFTRVDKAQRLARMSQEGNSRVLNYIQKLSNAIRIPLKPIHPMNTKLHHSLLCYEKITNESFDVTSFSIQLFTWLRITLLWCHLWWDGWLNDWRWGWWNKFNFGSRSPYIRMWKLQKLFPNFLLLLSCKVWAALKKW